MTKQPIKLAWTTSCGNPVCRKCSRKTAITAGGTFIGVEIEPNAPGEIGNAHMVGITVFPADRFD